jgi:hypothetical protein
MRLYLTLNMPVAVWDCCALTLFTHKIITIILNVNIGGIEMDTGPVTNAYARMSGKPGPQVTPKS